MEEEFLSRQYKSNSRIKMSDFYEVSIFPFRAIFPHCTDDRRKSFLPGIAAKRPAFPVCDKRYRSFAHNAPVLIIIINAFPARVKHGFPPYALCVHPAVESYNS